MTTKTNIEVKEFHVNDFMKEFCPFGWMDCKAAVETALEAGYDVSWAAEQTTNFCEETGTKVEDCDPVYCVYESLLQEARNEISDVANYDFINDNKQGEIYTAGNFMCTDYYYPQEAIDELTGKLAQSDITINDLSEQTQWFLSAICISQEDINSSK
jgi:hypothetical protein